MLITFLLCQRRKFLSFVCVYFFHHWNNHSSVNVQLSRYHWFVYVISYQYGCLRLCPSILTPHFLWQPSFLSQMPVENVTREESEIQCFHNHVVLLQWLKVKHQVYRVLYGCSNNSSEWLMPRKSPFIASFCVTETLVFYCRLTRPVVRYVASENIMVFAPSSVPVVRQKKGIYSSHFFFWEFIWTDTVGTKISKEGWFH